MAIIQLSREPSAGSRQPRSSLRWRLAWLATYPLARLLLRIRVSGRDKLNRGAQILAANHTSNVDPLIIGWAAARELHFLAKEELFRASRMFNCLIRAWNAWPVRRGVADSSAIKHCTEVLRRGQTLVLFPEGSRSRNGEICEFRPGIGLLATSARVPVVPTLISGVDRSWISYAVDRDFVKKGFRMKSRGSSGIEVRFGEPVYPDGFSRDRAGYVELARLVETRVREMAR